MKILTSIALVFLLLSPGFADPAPATEPATKEFKLLKDDKVSVTQHQMTVDGQVLKYEADAGTLVLKDDEGKPRANFFFVSYTRDAGKATDGVTRPITFVFNGGPGAAAVWLHLGTIGPMRLALPEKEAEPLTPPYRLVENQQTWLDATDLVFIDPVGTGFSRSAENVKPEEFFGVQHDVESVGEFIRLYLTRYQRWGSPKFLAGESYGTTRAAALSDYLLSRLGIQLNGIVFISTILDFQTLEAAGNNDEPYILSLPSYTAIAAYHHRLDPDLAKDLPSALSEVQKWALSDYTAALARGDDLPAADREQIAQKLSHYTSLPVDFIKRSKLRISAGVFRKQLLADQYKIVGRFDARYVGDDSDPAGDSPMYDPGFGPFLAAYTATFNDYVRGTLHYESDLTYEVLSGSVHPWDMDRGGGGYLDVTHSLRDAMLQSPKMKLMFASGYYDLATPYFSTDYTISHLDLSAELRGNITRTFYPSGHMIYHHAESGRQLKLDAVKFIAAAATTQPTR